MGKRLDADDSHSPAIIQRHDHNVSRQQVSSNALKVLYRLRKAGYQAYLVGGSVRDLLLQRRPKDFDIATDARPEEVRSLFRNSRLIGRRFRLVHVYFSEEIIEVSTFRAGSDDLVCEEDPEKTLLIRVDNTFGTIEEDAWRRDFTVNALYYNIADFSVVDYVGGMADLKERVIRILGDPKQRFHEDPVRLLRAIRLAAKLDFKVAKKTKQYVLTLSHLLQHVPASRLFDEVLKLFFEGNAVVIYRRLCDYDYLKVLFPQTVASLQETKNKVYMRLIDLAMEATDRRFREQKSLNPGFLLAVLLWPSVQQVLQAQLEKNGKFYQALHFAIDSVLREQLQTVVIPRRFISMMRSVWVLQYHLERRRGKRVYRTLFHRYFRAAYDFLELRAMAGEPHDELVDWWSQFRDASLAVRADMIKNMR